MAGCCQIGGCDRVGLDATRAFAGVEDEVRHCMDARQGTLGRPTGSFSDARIVEETIHRQSIASLHLVRPRATTACGLCSREAL
jgi:hypothetical protein